MALPPIGIPPLPGAPAQPSSGLADAVSAALAAPPPVDGGLPPVTGDGDAYTRITPAGEQVIPRDPPEPTERRKRLVTAYTDMIKHAKTHWDPIFKQMDEDQRFAGGNQWPEDPKKDAYNDIIDNDLYVANITLQHIQKRTAALYAKNPRTSARRRPRLMATVWDGSLEQLAQAQQTMQTAQAAMMGMPAGTPMTPGAPPPGAAGPSPTSPPGAPAGPGATPSPMGPAGMPMMAPPAPMPPPEELMQAQAVMTDAQNVKQQLDQLTKIGKTLQLVYDYEVSEQQQNFKSMMKMTVRRACTAGVGWTRLGFQRIMGQSPDRDSRIADMQSQLDIAERISADIADDEADVDSAVAEQMRLTIDSIKAEGEIVLREGLHFTWPKSNAIIPDPRCIQLRDFLGCDWAAEEFILTVNEIKETYKVDVGKHHTSYTRSDVGTDYERARVTWQANSAWNTSTVDDPNVSDGDADNCLVWELFNKRDGLVYVICDGYPDFLKEPSVPDVYTDRFWPWFLTAFNEIAGKIFPPSDVQLIRPMQRELNRSRQGLREHRFANRPKMAYAEGTLSEDDISALKSHPVNAVIGIAGLQPGQDINTVLMAIKGVPVDPNLYEVNPIFEDLMRAVGSQEADLGGTSGATATESSIAASAKASATGSAIDDIDDTLSAIARAGGQILLLNMTEETVKEIVGPGAMWPVLTKADVAKEIYLEIEAGSSGRPNQAQEMQNFERLAPVLMQIPGIKPQFLAKEALKRMDDKIDVDEAVAEGLPSITSMNGNKQPGMPGQANPAAQGPMGANNAPAAPQPMPDSPTPTTPAPTAPGTLPN